MLKKGLMLLAALLVMIPMLAFAGNVSTRVMTTGGSISVNGATAQTSANGTVTKAFTTAINVTITPTMGYAISAVTLTGATPALSSPLTVPLKTTSQSVTVSFTRQLASITSSATSADGTVSPYGTQSLYANTSATYTFTPNTGKSVVSIDGLPAGFTLKNSSNVVVTLPYAGQVKATFTVPATPVTIVASFVGIVANAGTPQTVLVNGSAALAGSAAPSAGTTFAWTQVSGPSATITDPTSATSAITFTTAGTYILKLTATNAVGTATATTSFTVTASAADAALVQCVNCHNSADVGAGNYAAWSASAHAVNTVMCYNCHAGANTGAHPGTLLTGSVNEATFNYTGTSNNFCTTCHNPAIIAEFAASPHVVRSGSASCSFCHVQGAHNPNAACVDCHNTGNLLGLPWPPTGMDFHNDFTGTNQCTNCHNTHNPAVVTFVTYPHFSTYSTAQFVTPKITCNNCHNSAENTFNVYPANREWATSGHGNPVSPAYIGSGPYTEANLEAFDFKFLGTPLPAKPATTTSQDCVRCHTTTGYINYVTPTNPLDPATAFSDIHAWGTPDDRTREMVACSACHNNTTGFDATISRRTVGTIDETTGANAVIAWYNYSSAATKKIIRSKIYTDSTGIELTDSNICVACHSGTSAGNLIKQTTSNPAVCASATLFPSIVCRLGNGNVANGLISSFWSTVDFIDSHGMASANIMLADNNRAGYEYRPNASTNHSHLLINTDSQHTEGPCVGCHMSAPKKHVFSPVSSVSNGVISAITSPLCANCHGGSGPGVTFNSPGDLQTRKDGYLAALTVIAAQLAAKGVHFNPAKPPYFFTTSDPALQSSLTRVTNWNIPAPLSQGAHLMGAAFNLRLFQSDAGWAHNGVTSKRLLYDTIDYLDDGNPLNNTVVTTIQNLAGVDQTVKNRATAYIGTRP